MGYAVGVHTEGGAKALTDFTVEQLGGIDILVNSSGGKVAGCIQDLDAGAFESSIDMQLKAPFLMAHYTSA